MSILVTSENTCVCCGSIIPEGRQVCMQCEMAVEEQQQSKLYNDTDIQYDIYLPPRNKHSPFHKLRRFWNSI